MLIILIAGPSGSGKTTVAKKIVGQIKTHATIKTLSIDRYYNDQSHLSQDERALINYDLPEQLDWNLLKQHVGDLKNNKSIEAPNFDFATHSRCSNVTIFEQPDILILEGIHGLHDEDLSKQSDLKIYINTNYANCYTRRLSRDMRERGRTADSVLRQFTEQVWPAAKTFVLPRKELANIVVDNNSRLSPVVIESVANKIKQLLNKPSPLIQHSFLTKAHANTSDKTPQQNQHGLRK